jgi:hypothetical protein
VQKGGIIVGPRRCLQVSLMLSALVALVLALTGAIAAAAPGEPATLPVSLTNIP